MPDDRAATLAALHATLAADFACAPEVFAQPGLTVTAAEARPGRRRFPIARPELKVMTDGRAIVATASAERLPPLQALLAGLAPRDLFDARVLAQLGALAAAGAQRLVGPAAGFVCWGDGFRPAPPSGVEVLLLEGERVAELYATPGFDHALAYSRESERPDVLAAAARVAGVVVGVAGVSADCERMWQIGVDVDERYRGRGIARELVSRATEAVLAAGSVPYYATPVGHLTSGRIAISLGYRPAWVDVWVLPGSR